MEAGGADQNKILFVGDSIAENYERSLEPVIFEPWAEVLLDVAAPQTGAAVLDVASGTGVVARAAARRIGASGRVVASDLSRDMLARAAMRPPPSGAAPIEFVEASADGLPFADQSFDLVLCQQGLQFFPDRVAALREMLRVTRADGVVAVAVWPASARVEPFDSYSEALTAAGMQTPLRHYTYALEDDLLKTLLDRAGATALDLDVLERELSWRDAEAAASGIQGTPYAPIVKSMTPEDQERLHRDLVSRFSPSAGPGRVSWTSSALVARAGSSAS